MTDPLALERASINDPVIAEQLTKNDELAIQKVRALSSPRGDIDGVAIDLRELHRRCPLNQNSVSTSSSQTHWKNTVSTRPMGPLGQLDKLPLETLQAIFALLDLQTLTDLRAVHRRAMQVVDSLPLYRQIYTHAPDVLRAMLSTKVARHFKLWSVSWELIHEDCYLCGAFGSFFFLPGCARCCWFCLTEHEDTLPISRAQAKESFELRNNALPEVEAILSLPGTYGIEVRAGKRIRGRSTYNKRTWLVGLWAGRKAARKLHGDERVVEAKMNSSRQSWTAAYMQEQRANRGHSHRRLVVPKPPFYPYMRGRPAVGNEPRRFLTAVRMPVLDTSTGRTEWGVSCLGCSKGLTESLESYSDIDDASHRQCQRMYSKQGLLRHVKHCEYARKRWRDCKPIFVRVQAQKLATEILDERGISWAWDEVGPPPLFFFLSMEQRQREL